MTSLKIQTASVEYTHEGLALRGYLAIPGGGPARCPGVLVGPEWWGLNQYARTRAEQLAGLGYVALTMDMYGEGKTTTDASTASAWAGVTRTGPVARERAACALRLLQSHPAVLSDRIA